VGRFFLPSFLHRGRRAAIANRLGSLLAPRRDRRLRSRSQASIAPCVPSPSLLGSCCRTRCPSGASVVCILCSAYNASPALRA
jgi:hypothetical protein